MELQPHTVAVVACKGLDRLFPVKREGGGRSGTHTTVPHNPWSMVVAPVQHDTCVLPDVDLQG
eukprot:5046969-Amphidinium_carterae.1